MKNDAFVPAWLTFVSQAPEHDPWIRLMMSNPLNGEVSVFVSQVIDLDDQRSGLPDEAPPNLSPQPEA